MAEIVNLQDFRTKAIEQRSFGPWRQRFGEAYGISTKPSDLSDGTLYFLAQPGEQSTAAYYELIMGILDLGKPAKFDYLANNEQMRVVDIHLFLADHVRFEMMRRLGWLDRIPGRSYNLLEMVRSFERVKAACRNEPLELARSHPGYREYELLTRGDKEVFIRRLLTEALDAFEERLES
ncbi:MAG: hypothetical protein JSW39_06895 [Desulfobacterales bacterium]|nr:MAG: hypothetical protein JSW39_06895 [Desulfobacterales bacterium]